MRNVIWLATLLLASGVATAQQRISVAVVHDGEPNRIAEQHEKLVDELLTLTEGEFDVTVKQYYGNWTNDGINATLDLAYQDPDTDLVLVTGFMANQLAATRNTFSKPTFLPRILDVALVGRSIDNLTSGTHNLNYLSAYANFAADLDALASVVPYSKLVLFVDEKLAAVLQQLRSAAFEASAARGVELIFVTHDGSDHRLMERVPTGTDAVFISALSRMPQGDFETLVSTINNAGLPSYSFVGVDDVESGVLMTNSEPRDTDRQARLNALNMQAVMLGEKASDQPVASEIRQRLTINMETARQIDVSPSFNVLSNAVILNREAEATGDEYGLVDIARAAIDNNPDLLAETYSVRAGREEIALARSNLLPQIGASSSYTLRKDSPTVVAGALSERSTDAGLNVDQLIYSDSASANLSIQKNLQEARAASLHAFRLDIIQAATSAYYNVLNARSQLSVQEKNLVISRANLELAETRVRLGTSSATDVYRWTAEVANAQILVLNARAQSNQAWDSLNRLLQRRQGERLALSDATFDEPFVMTQGEFDKIVVNQSDYTRFSNFYIERALHQAPELTQLDTQLAAKRRELKSQRRAYWLPDFSVAGRYTNNLGQSGLGAGPGAGQDLGDWNVGVQATLPLFSGGLKKANVSRSTYEIRQLEALRIATADRIEEEVRLQMHAAQAAYGQIDLSRIAAEASRKNFELVSDAYARGAISIIDLLDAQEASIAADARAAESLYSFLITIMAVQRAVGGFDFLLSDDARRALAQEMRSQLTGTLQ